MRYLLDCYLSPAGNYPGRASERNGHKYLSRAAAFLSAMDVCSGQTLIRIEFGQDPNDGNAAHYSIRTVDVNGDEWAVHGSILTVRA